MPELMGTPKNSFVLVHQNIRGIISKIEEIQEFFISDKMYPHSLCFSKHHLSRDEIHLAGIDNLFFTKYLPEGWCLYIGP
jgi:hypothetical protein